MPPCNHSESSTSSEIGREPRLSGTTRADWLRACLLRGSTQTWLGSTGQRLPCPLPWTPDTLLRPVIGTVKATCLITPTIRKLSVPSATHRQANSCAADRPTKTTTANQALAMLAIAPGRISSMKRRTAETRDCLMTIPSETLRVSTLLDSTTSLVLTSGKRLPSTVYALVRLMYR